MAWEKLVKYHGFCYGRETLRMALIEAGVWKPTRQTTPVIHSIRERRACEGELVQIDGSPHAWFEDRGEPCTLLVYIDDATGKLKILAFAPSETTNAYFQATRQYIEQYGKPLAFYSDKHGVFRVNTTKNQSAATEDSNGLTQFGRAMSELHIEAIFANSPQAKGRVERVNQTLQDRLVKKLRLRNISTIQEANQYIPKFMREFNAQFSVQPKSTVNMHRPLETAENLDRIFVQKHARILSRTLSISYGNRTYQVDRIDQRMPCGMQRLRYRKIPKDISLFSTENRYFPITLSPYNPKQRSRIQNISTVLLTNSQHEYQQDQR